MLLSFSIKTWRKESERQTIVTEEPSVKGLCTNHVVRSGEGGFLEKPRKTMMGEGVKNDKKKTTWFVYRPKGDSRTRDREKKRNTLIVK